MPLTRDFKETIRARVGRDSKFRKELLRERIPRRSVPGLRGRAGPRAGN